MLYQNFLFEEREKLYTIYTYAIEKNIYISLHLIKQTWDIHISLNN